MKRAAALGLVLVLAAGASLAGQSREDLAFIVRSQSEAKNHGHSHGMSPSSAPVKSESDLEWAAMTLIRLYQRFISSQDGPICNFTLSCSGFGLEAVRKYGIIHGAMMASDRLQRCNGFGRASYPQDSKTLLAIDLPLDMYYLGGARR